MKRLLMMYRGKETKGKRIQGMEFLEYLYEHKKWMPFAAAFILIAEAVMVPAMLLTGHLGYSAAFLWLSVGMILLSLVLTGAKFLLALTFLVFEYIYLYTNVFVENSSFIILERKTMTAGNVMVNFFATVCLLVLLLYFQNEFCLYEKNRIATSGKRIERARSAKSQFLANMSYEIRTPMNSIISLSEIMLKEELDGEIRTEVNTIRSASYDLLAIIDDVLTYAKIDAGSMKLVKEKYSFKKLAEEVMRTISEELHKKKLYLDVRIDHDIPRELSGDSAVIRQIFLSLLFISIDSTSSGRIMLEVTCESDHETKIATFHCKVADTGRGLSQIDIQSLFGMYETYDSKQSSNLKGIGLKYSICKELLSMMQGDIRVESIEGIGLSASFTFCNEITDEEPMIALEDEKTPNVLIYTDSDLDIAKWQNIMEGFGVRPSYSRTYYGFDRAIRDKHYDFIFVPGEFYENVSNIISLYQCEEFTYILAEYSAVYGDFGKCRLIHRPFSSISVSEVLNHKWNKEDYKKSAVAETFVAKNARVLVVDDNAVNLKVAAGIFGKYGIDISLATCGKDSIRKIERETYDLILMDMVMPDMSGSDVLKQIRAKRGNYYKEVPFVALTAQNGVNVREEMLNLGFQDYLAKPIRRRNLEECLLSFLPEELIEWVKTEDVPEKKQEKKKEKEKKQQQAESGLNTERGLLNIGFNQEAYAAILNTYYSEGMKYLDILPQQLEEGNIQHFTTNVHGIKSSSASIGAMEVAELFKELEFDGKENRVEEIGRKFPVYMEKFRQILGIVREYLISNGMLAENTKEENLEMKEVEELTPEMLQGLKTELDKMNLKVTDELIPKLASRNFGSEANEQIRQLKEAYDMFDFHQVKMILNQMLS